MSRPQFTIRALLVLLLAVACFFGGIRFERERRRHEDKAAALAARARTGDALLRFYDDPAAWEIVLDELSHDRTK